MSDVPLDWSPFGGNPVPGDPGRVRTLAQSFHDFVGQVGQQHSLLMDVHNGVGGVWMSPAGRAFSPHLGQLPGQLQKLHSSYSDAADALDAYWPELQDAQTMATTALAKVHAAIQAQQAAQAAQTQDYQAFQAHQSQLQQQAQQKADQTGLPVTLQLASYSPSPAVVAQTTSANQAYQAAMNLKDQAVQKAQSAAQRLSSALDGASKAGIQNPGFDVFGFVHTAESWWDDASSWVDHHAGEIETVVAVAALGPAGFLLTSDGRALLKHAMEAMNPVFEVVSGVCGVLSFGLAIVGFIPGIGEVADALNEGVTLIKTGADAGMLVDGELEGDRDEVKEAEENLVGDAAGLVTGGESRLLDGVETIMSKSGEIAEDADKIDQFTEDANQARSEAAEALSMAKRADEQAKDTESAAAAARANGDVGKADMLDENAAKLRERQSDFQKQLKDAVSRRQTALSKVDELNGKVGTLTDRVSEARSAAGQAKAATGEDALEKLNGSGGLKGWASNALNETKSSENLGDGVGNWAKSYFGAGGNKTLAVVRLTKYGLLGADFGHSIPDQPKNIHRIEEGVHGLGEELGVG